MITRAFRSSTDILRSARRPITVGLRGIERHGCGCDIFDGAVGYSGLPFALAEPTASLIVLSRH